MLAKRGEDEVFDFLLASSWGPTLGADVSEANLTLGCPRSVHPGCGVSPRLSPKLVRTR